jgi:hypothetical protein
MGSSSFSSLAKFGHQHHPLSLPNWQVRRLEKLNAEELKVKNMAWVPKQSVQFHGKKDNVMKGTKETKGRRPTKDHSQGQRFAPNHQNYWSSDNRYFTSTPSMPILWSPPSGMFSYPSWPYFDPLMSYKSLYHGGFFLNNYVFEW